MLKWPICLCLLFAAGAIAAEITPWYPPKLDVRPVEVVAAPAIPGGAAKQARSLNGIWKISDLENSARPFPDESDKLRRYELPAFDDANWTDIAVPLNWYKAFPALKLPYFRGWYRVKFALSAEELAGRRVILKFGVIGYDATLYVNGVETGRHHGDFTPFELDVTDRVNSGENLLAIRVLSDLGYSVGRVQNITHGYGSQWGKSNLKGGIWQDVSLSLEPELRLAKILATPRLAKSGVEVDYTVWNHTGKNWRGEISGTVTSAVKTDAGKSAGALPPMQLELVPGFNQGTLFLPLSSPVPWSPEQPYLYHLTLRLTKQGALLAADSIRFGYRDFRARNGKFYLNGKEIYLFGENISSYLYGGHGPGTAQFAAAFARELKQLRDRGYVIVRPAHMPVPAACLEKADELGMMIYQEWCWAFSTQSIAFPAFEKNNEAELREFVEAAYNHPSVVMWSLGNELNYRNPAVEKLLNRQSALVRKLDKSDRPISVFSGAAGGYGDTALDTDVLDKHDYAGLSYCWTLTRDNFQKTDRFLQKNYAKDGRIPQPRIAWETIGFSWGGSPPDPSFRPGDIRQYAEYLAKPYSWGKPNGRGYICLAPLERALKPNFAAWAQDRFGHRIFELYRLNPDYSGFAPWLARAATGTTLWTQKVYPALRGESYLPPHNLFSGETAEFTLEVMNDSDSAFSTLILELELFKSERERIALPSIPVGELAAHARIALPVRLPIPAGEDGHRQLRLTLREEGKEAGRNFYDLFLGPRAILEQAIAPVRPVFVLDTRAPQNRSELERILDRFRIPYSVAASPDAAEPGALLIIPPELHEKQTIDLEKDAAFDRFLKERHGLLLILEQRNPESRFSGGEKLLRYGNHFVDPVSPEHPLFSGLTAAEFDTWNNPDHGYVVSSAITPCRLTALAVKGVYPYPDDRDDFGSAILEGTVGKGRILHSQLEAVRCAPRDSAAARYLANLFAYAAGMRTLWQGALPLDEPLQTGYTASDKALEPIDLAPYANISFRDEVENDGRGGWTDQGANDFRMMPTGIQTAAGVRFNILDPAENGGKSCIGLRGSRAPHYPAAVRGIRIPERKYGRIFFQHTAAWVSDRRTAWVYRMHYADGTQTDFPIVSETNLGDWYRVFALPEAKIGISRKGALGRPVCTFVTEWRNPHPGKPLVAIDLLTAAEAGPEMEWVVTGETVAPTPVIVAITGDRVTEKPLDLLAGETFIKAGAAGKSRHPVRVTKRNDRRELSISYPDGKAGDQASATLLRYRGTPDPEAQYLVCRVSSDRDGVVTVVLPEKEWRGRFSGEIRLRGDNLPRTYYLRLGKELKSSGRAALENLRNEVLFYHTPGSAMNLKLEELRLE